MMDLIKIFVYPLKVKNLWNNVLF